MNVHLTCKLMTPKQMAHEFFLGIRQAMTCPDVSVAEYENVMACKIESALATEREACAKIADRARVTSDGPKEIAETIRKRG